MHLKASAKRKTKVHWKRHLSDRGTEDLLGVMPPRPRQEFPQRSATLWKRLKPVWCWHSLRVCSIEDSSFRVWQNCKEGLNWWNKMKRAHETTAKHSCYPVMCYAWLHQQSSIALHGVCIARKSTSQTWCFFPWVQLIKSSVNQSVMSVKTFIVLFELWTGVKCKLHRYIWMSN